jgi:predicted nucleotide-binding protein
MAQRKVNTPQSVITVLTISKDEFKNSLAERINIGQELLGREVRSNEEFEQLRDDYRLWSDYNFEYLKQVFNTPDNEYKDNYNQAGFHFMGQMGEVKNDPVQTQKNLIKYKLDDLRALLAKANLLKSEISNNTPTKEESKKAINKTHVFIVHGHDDLAKIKVARFIEMLGLKPTILHEQTSSGRTIIEKIEEYSNVGFGIVLYTPCDVGAKQGNEANLQPRARQNVVFEHGYLIGKIGRNNVCALVKNEVETPNDISGVIYVKMDDEDSWHLKVAKELRSSGYSIDLNLL